MDSPAEKALARAEFHQAVRAVAKTAQRAQDPTAIAKEEVEVPQVTTTPHRARISGIKMIKNLRLEDSVHG
jgi:hypothetical protein